MNKKIVNKSITYLKCFDIRGDEDLVEGEVYEASQTFDWDGDLVYFITDSTGGSQSFTVEPDENGLSYKDWFTIVEKPVTMEEDVSTDKDNTKFVLIHMDTYYPSILHFDTHVEAKKWLDKHLKNPYMGSEFSNFYIAEIKEVHVGEGNSAQEVFQDSNIEWNLK